MPITGLAFADGLESVSLAPGVDLVRFTDQEFVRVANKHMFVFPVPVARVDIIPEVYRFGVRVSVDVPSISGADVHLDAPVVVARNFGDRSLWFMTADLVEDLLVLRLVTTQLVVTPGADVQLDHPWGGPTSSTMIRNDFLHAHFGREVVMDRATSERLPELWSALQQPSQNELSRTCIRRFSSAVDRRGTEDAIVDIFIAAEALFLRDRGQDLGKRLQSRAAKLLAIRGADSQETMRVLKSGYKLRGDVVHGTDLRLADNSHRDLVPPVDELIAIMRQAIQICASECVLGKQFGTVAYWNELLGPEVEGVGARGSEPLVQPAPGEFV